MTRKKLLIRKLFVIYEITLHAIFPKPFLSKMVEKSIEDVMNEVISNSSMT